MLFWLTIGTLKLVVALSYFWYNFAEGLKISNFDASSKVNDHCSKWNELGYKTIQKPWDNSITVDIDSGKTLKQSKFILLKHNSALDPGVTRSFKLNKVSCKQGGCKINDPKTKEKQTLSSSRIHLPNFQIDASNFKLAYLPKSLLSNLKSEENELKLNLILSYLEPGTRNMLKSLKFNFGTIKNSRGDRQKTVSWKQSKLFWNFNPSNIQNIDVTYGNLGSASGIGVLVGYTERLRNGRTYLRYLIGGRNWTKPIDVPLGKFNFNCSKVSVSLIDIDQNGIDDLIIHIVNDNRGFEENWVSIGKDILKDGTVSKGWEKLCLIDTKDTSREKYKRYVKNGALIESFKDNSIYQVKKGKVNRHNFESSSVHFPETIDSALNRGSFKERVQNAISEICSTCSSLSETTLSLCKSILKNSDAKCVLQVREAPSVDALFECSGLEVILVTNPLCETNGLTVSSGTGVNLLPVVVTVIIRDNTVGFEEAINIALSKLPTLPDYSIYFDDPVLISYDQENNGDWTVKFSYETSDFVI